MLPVNATSCCCFPPFGSCTILLSLVQILALLLPPLPSLPPPSLCVCFRSNSLHPYIHCTSQQQPSAQHWWVGWQRLLIRKWNCPQKQVGLWEWEVPDYSCSALPSALGLGTRSGCPTWLFLHWQVNSAGARELCARELLSRGRTAISLDRPCGDETFRWWGL